MFNNLNVGKRLALGFAAVLVLMVLISGISLVRLAAIKSDLAAVTGEDAERLRLANVLRDMARYQAVTLRDAVLQDDMSFKKKELGLIKSARVQYDKAAAELSGMAVDPALKAALEKAAAALEGTKGPIEVAIDRSMSDDLPGTAEAIREQVRPAQIAHVAALDKVIETALKASQLRNEQADAGYRQAVTIIVALSLAALVAGVLIAWRIQRGIAGPLGEAVRVAQAVADGDLTQRIAVRSKDEVGQLLQALSTVNGNLSRTLQSVQEAASTVLTASSEIASGNNELSRRTEQQAASLEQTAASMDEMNSTVRSNADTARTATQLAGMASESALKGGEVVGQVVSTMQAIAASSNKITDIVGTIDGIAFQTNILALNAAVEAARAGEQGRGFAVVASEVRSLAQRSAVAAREVKALIGSSVETVTVGTRLAGDAGATMNEIVERVQRVTTLIGEISTATSEQTQGIGQVSTAVQQLDQATQQNAALVEESAAAAESLRQQAEQLVQAVSVFRLP